MTRTSPPDRGPSGRRQPGGFWTRRLTNVYTAAASGIVGVGSWWLRSSGQWSADSVRERRGQDLPAPAAPHPVWIHAASMGEVRVAAQFAPELIERGHAVITSSMTEPGFNLCHDVFSDEVACFRVPFDLPGPIRRVLRHFRPSALVLVETEWWPNILQACASAGVPVYVINGRLSRRAFGRYRLGRTYWRSLLAAVDFFYMRSHDDAERLRALGIESSRIRAMGTLKAVTIAASADDPELQSGGVDSLGGPVWVAGCTRPGEEEIVLEAFGILRREFPALQLWLAPRHPQRFDSVAAFLQQRSVPFRRWSEPTDSLSAGDPSVWLVDRMGVLANLYRHADAAFVGGSLMPFGGHNPLEPALHGIPVTFGQHMNEQRDAADLLLASGVAREVWGAESLAMTTADQLRNAAHGDERRDIAARLRRRLDDVRGRVADDLCARLKAFTVSVDLRDDGSGDSAGRTGFNQG